MEDLKNNNSEDIEIGGSEQNKSETLETDNATPSTEDLEIGPTVNVKPSDLSNIRPDNSKPDVANGLVDTAAGLINGDTNSVIKGLNTALGDAPKEENDLSWILKGECIEPCPDLPKKIRLGRILYTYLEVNYIESFTNIDAPINKFDELPHTDINLQLHTHGITCHSLLTKFKIHNSQIISIDKKEIKYDYRSAAKRALNSGVAKATIGYMMNDVGAVIDGAKQTFNEGIHIKDDVEKFMDSGEYLVLRFWDVKTKSKRRLIFKVTDSRNNATKEFIDRYNKELSINNQTGRKAFFIEATPIGYIGYAI